MHPHIPSYMHCVCQKFFPIGWYYLRFVFKDPIIQKKAITEDEAYLNTFRTENSLTAVRFPCTYMARIRPLMSN